jgi:hypothetical protein
MRTMLWGAVVACAAVAGAADVLSQIGVTPDAAKQAVTTLVSNGISNPGLPSKVFKLLPPPARAEAATAGVAWLKTYVATPEFAQQYAKIRDARKPEAPVFEGTPEDELKKANEEAARQLEESKKALAALPPDQRKALEESMKQAAAAQDNPEMRKARLEAIETDRGNRTKEYRTALANWQRDFPENSSALVAKRLREFLDVTANVDFTATLKPQDNVMLFEKSEYQNKPAPWKLCYRAGKEATTAARAAAQAWLKDLTATAR